jgi:hypothetical protein
MLLFLAAVWGCRKLEAGMLGSQVSSTLPVFAAVPCWEAVAVSGICGSGLHGRPIKRSKLGRKYSTL